MNQCNFVGNMAGEPEYRTTQNGVAQCSFRVAVKRRFKDAQGNYPTDFINFVAWRQSAEYVRNYLHTGDTVAVSGSMQNHQHQAQDGTTRYITEIVVDNVSCVRSKQRAAQSAQEAQPAGDTIAQAQATFGAGFVEVDEGDELPF